MPSSNNDDDNNNHDVEEGEDVHSNAWESAKNDRKYQAGQQQQQQGSGERTHESLSASASSTSTSWHQQDEEHAAGLHQNQNHQQQQQQQQQHWSDDTFGTNVSSMETATGAAAGVGTAGLSRGQMRHNQHHASSSLPSPSSPPSCTRKIMSCSCTVLRKLSRPQTLLNFVDWSVIILVVIYVVMLQHQQQQHQNDDDDNGGGGSGSSSTNDLVLEFLSIGLATILFVRFIVTSSAIPCLSERRCSKNLTAHLTLGMCVSYGILGVTGWIVVSKLPTTASPPWCPKSTNSICQEYPGGVPVVLIVLCIVEGMRWVYAQGVLRQYVQDHPDPTSSSSANTSHRTSQYPHSPGASSSHRSRNRPWWWNHRNQAQNGGGHEYDEDGRLQEPLIHGQPGWTRSGGGTYMVDDGVSTPRRSGGLFGWMNGGISSTSRTGNNNHSNNDDPRDDGSVDYASLSEDWASRSEEDPYWWTQSDS